MLSNCLMDVILWFLLFCQKCLRCVRQNRRMDRKLKQRYSPVMRLCHHDGGVAHLDAKKRERYEGKHAQTNRRYKYAKRARRNDHCGTLCEKDVLANMMHNVQLYFQQRNMLITSRNYNAILVAS